MITPAPNRDVSAAFTSALAKLIFGMLSEGYKCDIAYPSDGSFKPNSLGWSVCQRCKCSLHYEHFTLHTNGVLKSDRTFTICTQCGHVREF